ncbi:unnamed protein product [Leptidea sinapis]|uniref:Uncharacterized protein n=1 Tax=Leptidea sinapis TaxID=189913 RepID=A0A5E4Q5X6_9NEOP|nr:unnamed protein product [Leptidea sinapis]
MARGGIRTGMNDLQDLLKVQAQQYGSIHRPNSLQHPRHIVQKNESQVQIAIMVFVVSCMVYAYRLKRVNSFNGGDCHNNTSAIESGRIQVTNLGGQLWRRMETAIQ